MKIYKISIIFLILMIFSVGFVFAEDVNQTDSDLEVTDGDVISVDDQSYNDLQNKFPKEMPAEVNLTTDYSFDVTKDKYYYVDIIGSAGKSYTINGNNKVINGKGDAGALRIYNATLTIKNLTIQNCARSSIIVENSTLILNNVKFMDNNDNSSGAAIYSYFAAVTADNCTFSENYATRGAAINVERSVLSISETKFTNKNSMVWSLIYAETNSEVYINYCRFENLKSKYATVVFASNSHIRAYQSTFVNLTATATGGAIASKNLNKNVIIQNCEFENVKSAKNGGAIFIDVNADSDSYLRGTSVINLTKFINCSSEFGGAILQLGGFLNVLGSYFSNNHAVYDGGAIYSSNATFYAVNSVFNNNYGEKVSDSLSRGGALYLDDSNDIEIASSNFTDNKASEGGAIFLFDTSFVIYDSSSINNGEFLHSYFNSQTSNFKNCYLGPQDKRDNYTFDDAYYPSVVSFEGKQIILNRLPITGNVTDSFFDLRNFNAVTPVKDQGSNGACWAFGTTGALESAFKIVTGITLDISEDNIQNSGLRYSFYGKPSLTEGGKLLSGLGYVLSWLGIVNTEYDGYDELGKISQILFTPDSYHFTDVMLINTKNSTAVKQALLDYGALTIHINGADPQNKYYNKTSHALYCNNESLGNHFVTLVGWNDTYSRSNFIIDPGMDGAWIVKNSWGTGWGDEGYFYLSYADAPFLDADAVCYIINNTVVYNKLYQYDIPAFDGFLIYDDVNSLSYTNTYESIGNDLISAVGTYFKNNKTSYTINVKVNGNVVYSQKGTSAYYGFQTIKLNNPVAVNNGDKFSIEIEVDTNTVPFLSDSRLFFQKDHSVVNTPKGYEELANRGRTASIKVYTINNVNNVSGVKVVLNPKSNITIKSTVEGATITISQNGKNIASTTVKDGKAVFNTTLSSGNYTIITSYGDEDIMSLLEIYPSIVVSDYEINRTVNGALDLLIIFFDDDDYLNNTSIAGTLDGKNIVVGITDVNGTLYINNLNLDVGTHKLTVSNPVTGEEDSITINIFSRFGSAGNIEMDYFDGSAFKVIVYDDYGNPVSKGQKVTINIKNKNYIAYTDAKGYVSFVIPEDITPGSYILKVTYQGQTISKTLKVKQVLKSKKTVKVKKSAKKLVLKATLKTSKNKAIKGKKITFKINGKKLTAKTNKKGLAKVTVKKSVLKKLKAGKKYAVKISYLKDTIKSTLKVKK